MSESQTPRGKDAERDNSGRGRATASSQIVLPVKVQAAGNLESWIGYTCQNPGQEPLSKVIHVVRESLDLDDSIELKICTSVNGNYLDQNIPLEDILGELRYGDYLVTYVESVEEIEIETQEPEGVEKSRAAESPEKVRPIIQRSIVTSKQIQIGESEQHVNVHVKRPVISIEGGYVLIEQQLLNLLRERVERPLMLESVCVFLGVALGSIITFSVALKDSGIGDGTRGFFQGALGASIVASVFLLILGYFVQVERKKDLQPIINELKSSRIPSQTGGKGEDVERL